MCFVEICVYGGEVVSGVRDIVLVLSCRVLVVLGKFFKGFCSRFWFKGVCILVWL